MNKINAKIGTDYVIQLLRLPDAEKIIIAMGSVAKPAKKPSITCLKKAKKGDKGSPLSSVQRKASD